MSSKNSTGEFYTYQLRPVNLSPVSSEMKDPKMNSTLKGFKELLTDKY